MKIIALEQEQPGLTSSDFQPHLEAEAAAVWRLYRDGLVRELYFNAQEHTAVLMLECDDLSQAEQALAGLPLAQAGLIRFQLIPLAPYDGFERLFRPEGDKNL